MPQMGLGIASIGGKDSMSGSLKPGYCRALVAFATAIGNTRDVQSPEFKKADSAVAMLRPSIRTGLPEIGSLIAALQDRRADDQTKARCCLPLPRCAGGVAEALFSVRGQPCWACSSSNDLNFNDLLQARLRQRDFGAAGPVPAGESSGFTTVDYTLEAGEGMIGLADCRRSGKPSWSRSSLPQGRPDCAALDMTAPANKHRAAPAITWLPRGSSSPLPGTNCEYDTARAFRQAGGDPHILVLKNLRCCGSKKRNRINLSDGYVLFFGWLVLLS